MKMVNLRNELENTLGISCKYGKNDLTSKPPFLMYSGAGAVNKFADNKVYSTKSLYNIGYYFKNKDEAFEKSIENVFNSNNIIWEKSEDIFVATENIFGIVYQIEIIEKFTEELNGK